MRESEAMESWERDSEVDEGAIAARKRWKVIVERFDDQGAWTKGDEYVKLWKEVSIHSIQVIRHTNGTT